MAKTKVFKKSILLKSLPFVFILALVISGIYFWGEQRSQAAIQYVYTGITDRGHWVRADGTSVLFHWNTPGFDGSHRVFIKSVGSTNYTIIQNYARDRAFYSQEHKVDTTLDRINGAVNNGYRLRVNTDYAYFLESCNAAGTKCIRSTTGNHSLYTRTLPTCSMNEKNNTTVINKGQTIYLGWEATNAIYVLGNWSSEKLPVRGNYYPAPQASTTYVVRAIDAAGAEGSCSYSVTVRNTPPPPLPPPPTDPGDPGDSDDTGSGGPTSDSGGSDESGSNEDIAAPIIEDKEAPSVPANLKGEFNSDKNSIELSWDSSTDNNEVVGYEIQRTEKDKNDWQKINDTDTTEYSDFKFAPNKTYSYRAKAYDQAKNYSEPSDAIDVSSGQFTPNINPTQGGEVQSEDGLAIVQVPGGAVDSEIFISIEKTNKKDFEIDKNSKIVGDIYEIRAKNSLGEEVKNFKTQITVTLRFSSKSTGGTNTGTIKIGNFDGEKVNFAKTSLDTKNGLAQTLTNHLSPYFLVAQKEEAIYTFLRIMLWVVVIIGMVVGGYFGWRFWQSRQYQKEHREDYIYNR